jgi:hypothetical protein
VGLADILGRIEERLTALNLSATGAARLAGKPDAIRNIRRAVRSGTREGVSTAMLASLAPVLQTTSKWLLTGEGEIEAVTSAEALAPPGHTVEARLAAAQAETSGL